MSRVSFSTTLCVVLQCVWHWLKRCVPYIKFVVCHIVCQSVVYVSVNLITDYEKLSPKTRTRNLHEIEHALFDARNSHKKYFAASRYDTRTSFLARFKRNLQPV